MTTEVCTGRLIFVCPQYRPCWVVLFSDGCCIFGKSVLSCFRCVSNYESSKQRTSFVVSVRLSTRSRFKVLFRPRYEPYVSGIQIRRFNLLLLKLLLLLLLLPPPPLLLSLIAYLRTSIVVKRLAVLLVMSLCTVMFSGPTEALR